MNNPITIETTVSAPINKIWEYWNNPEHITKWAYASDDWEAPEAENDLRAGGRFRTKMAARDGSTSFDFSGTYMAVVENQFLEFSLDDGRLVRVEFSQLPEGVKIVEIFEAETENTRELQKSGWQAILNNFKNYAERKGN
ncbi:MAG: SRPBCC domain-containing protein [Candidatus Shapirobacteria bacterium]